MPDLEITARVGRGWERRLQETDAWIDAKGQRHLLCDMETRYLVNVEAYVRREQERIFFYLGLADAYLPPFLAEMREKHDIPLLAEESDPQRAVVESPIMRAIAAELRRRQDI